ncbi:MAG: carbohydrate ABC transporter permease [Firmicutes bacterium]|jgi:ABC-type glycerol-3-phosphate transport system permease component|uniref:Sugar ABC transporter permease n=1 Tax=Sulfobacillus benefaciens TaxID=453960 RepID=A0A2T2X4C1_9FIRM|nr:carbohydrate ABC transporter permease [Bacillota bacterium]MCL5013967.1 carbohydrate ABC transporter permease [Bacillota bacterium]PSR29329.1 MAG: sugar ABC transporter permease [Sulfobacillus benefaciens]
MRTWFGRTGFYVLVAVIILYSLFPFYWVFKSSMESSVALNQPTTGMLPVQWTFVHYEAIFAVENFLRPLLNSMLVAGLTTIVSVILGSMAAYGLARMPIKGKALILGFVLLVSFFPQIAMVGPLYLVFRHLHWLNTYQSLVIPYLILALPITTWILTAFFGQIPVDIEEAAMVDGASIRQTILKVFAPIALPGIFTAAILGFLLSWNDFLFALSFIQSPNMDTVPLALVNFRNAYYVHYGQIYAGVVVASLPIALIVLFLQQRIESGLTAGSVKG